MDQDTKQEMLDKLMLLTNEAGVQRPGLYARVGSELRKYWQIAEEDQDYVKAIVICQIERLLEEVCDEDAKLYFRVAFNLKPAEGEEKLALGVRLQRNALDSNQYYGEYRKEYAQKFLSNFDNPSYTRAELAAVLKRTKNIDLSQVEDSPDAESKGTGQEATESNGGIAEDKAPDSEIPPPGSNSSKKGVLTRLPPMVRYVLAGTVAVVLTSVGGVGFYLVSNDREPPKAKQAGAVPVDVLSPSTSPQPLSQSPSSRSSSPAWPDCAPTIKGSPITCMTPPKVKDTKNLAISLMGGSAYLFAGSPAELANIEAPPEFPEHAKLGHCDYWENWILRQSKVYRVFPTLSVGVKSQEGELVVLKNIESLVYSRVRLKESGAVRLRCENGAGGDGVFIQTDTVTKANRVFNDNDGTQKLMPPTAVVLDAGKPGYQGAIIEIRSHPRYVYTGTIVITMEVKGKVQQIRFGTPLRPFRWVGSDGPEKPHEWMGPSYDWSLSEKRWKQVSDYAHE
ncbi:hypothetical protein ETD83_29540 [Actinomadura soli]|uniref:Uncharacterized protein n=1 Tax=Actinomadura soli TaxID=2508997 RepID=A0A5C4J4I5_9ACTN|nr:hypothetical protein [Actinomadura soli]TMQ91747.1 hypothetical protein ETD83_29540 [Actinomadura soli]